MRKTAVIISFIIATTSASASQVDFPTGDPGVAVSFLETGPEHPTACVAALTGHTPAVSFTVFSNGQFSITLITDQKMRPVANNSSATVKINASYISSKVKSSFKQGNYTVITLTPSDDKKVKTAYDALNVFTFQAARVDAVVDDALLPSLYLQPAPGLADAFAACQKYLVEHF